MSRPKREWYPGATYHVLSRGNRRLVLYKDEADYLLFLQGIERVKKKHPFKIHALCLMTNHFHMAIETGQDELWKVMSQILHPYAMNFNRKYNYTGHLFEHRYVAQLIEDERYFLEVTRYIHLNPVKAQMVREPLAYEYSSYRKFMNSDESLTDGKDRPQTVIGKLILDMVETSRVFDCFRHNSIEQYRMFVEGKISHAEQEMLIMTDMKEDEMWLPWG